MGGDQDDTVIIPLRAGQIRLFGSSSINSILIQASGADQITRLTSEVSTLLRSRHKIQAGAADDFTVRNNSEMLSTITSVSTTLTYLLAAWRLSRWWWAASGS